MSGRVPVLRSPQIAPVYALVLAFAAVAVASWILPGPVDDLGRAPEPDRGTITVRLSGDDLPADLRIAVGKARDGAVVGTDGTAKVASGATQLCLLSDEPVRVAGAQPLTECVSGTTTAIEVEHVVVRVEPVGSAGGGTVTVGGEEVDLDNGRYRPDRSLVGRTVCFTPPAGTTVAQPPPGADHRSCSTPKNPLADVVFEVVQ